MRASPVLVEAMPLLDAFLAFALTMLALATVVSMIVGIVRSVFRLQRSSVDATLRQFLLNQVVAPIRAEKDKLTKKTADCLAQSIKDKHKRLAQQLRHVTSRHGEGFEGIFMMEARYAPVDGAGLLKVLKGS